MSTPPLTASKEDLEWLKKKEQDRQMDEFEKWAVEYFGPEEVRKLEPQLLEKMATRIKQETEETCDLMKRIRLLKLQGPQTKDDLFFEYLLKQGKLKVPKWERLYEEDPPKRNWFNLFCC